MITCTKCKTENPLGRVFCVKCGSKLDLSRMTSDTVAEIEHVSWTQQHWKKVVAGVIAVIVAVGGLAFWPRPEIIGKKGSGSHQRYAESKIKALTNGSKGVALSTFFTEEEINAYVDNVRTKMKVDSLTISAKKGYFEVRLINVFGPVPLYGGNQLAPPVSYDLKYGIRGGKPYVVKAAMGHLPLPGGSKSVAVNAVMKALANDPDLAVFKYMTDLKAEEGKLTVVVKQ